MDMTPPPHILDLYIVNQNEEPVPCHPLRAPSDFTTCTELVKADPERFFKPLLRKATCFSLSSTGRLGAQNKFGSEFKYKEN